VIRKKDALDYHQLGRHGKIEVVPTKPCSTQRELSLAYTPGVAEPCLEIKKDPSKVFQYTTRGNLVAVVTNGTAVLGLGKIGPLAAKPVMEGKAILFKRLADIDVFDIELNAEDPDRLVQVVQALEPTFGGINLEDIRSPDCFYVEERLRKAMKIPVFHDDQHGTAIITGAALMNALDLVEKKISDVKIVFCGAGAAGIACAKFLLSLGAQKEQITMVDAAGVIYEGRSKGIDPYKSFFAQKTKARQLSDAMKGADVFFGLSVKGALKKEMVRSMAKNPLVFAMANPDPEITPEDALSVRKETIMATGRSDYPNQVNNVLGFPFIFRGALDVAARTINEEMKIAAAKALSRLAREEVPESVSHAYGDVKLKFGPHYIIPKPFDPRVLLWVAPAVAKAAMESGAARKEIQDLEAYRQSLEKLQGLSRGFMRDIINKARGRVGALPKRKGTKELKRIVFPEGEDTKIIQAAQIILDEGLAMPILLGSQKIILKIAKDAHLDLKGAEMIEPAASPKRSSYVQEFYELRKSKGMTKEDAEKLISTSPVYFGCMMVRSGDADGLVCGVTKTYPETIRPALQVVKVKSGFSVVAGLYVVVLKEKVLFFSDTTVNIDPTAEQLAEIAIATADKARYFNIDPKVAMLSFSNFGSTKHPFVEKVQKAVQLVKEKRPDIVVAGELMADVAVEPELLQQMFPSCELKGGANVLIFPDLQSGNIAYKLMRTIGRAEVVGPILLGMSKPVHVLQHNCDINDIVNMTAVTVLEAK
jgi:malate dehydrogenase (oxaloacetate-decarboxylating)(NADP+)